MTDSIVNPGEGSLNALEDQLWIVAACRTDLAVHKTSMDARRLLFDALNADAILGLEEARTRLASAEMEARDLALVAYAETGSKQPSPGVGIRVTTRLVYDRYDALRWAKEHSLALALDAKAFEGYAKASPDTFPIVTFTQEPMATISSDLSKALSIEPVQR